MHKTFPGTAVGILYSGSGSQCFYLCVCFRIDADWARAVGENLLVSLELNPPEEFKFWVLSIGLCIAFT